MINQYSKIGKLISLCCPNGVEFKKLGEVCKFRRGSSITKKDVTGGDIPVIAGGQKPAYYHNIANRNGETISVSSSGAYAGFVNFWTIPIFLSDSFSVDPDLKILLPKYVFYFLKNLQEEIHLSKKGGGVPHVRGSDLAAMKIPIPPFPIQGEIVKILNMFTELEAEIEAEIEARNVQYGYYRKKLLEPKKNSVEWMRLGDVAKYRRGSFPQPYGESRWYDGEDAMPFVQVADVDGKMTLVNDTKRKISKLAQTMSVFVPAGTVLVTLQGSIGRVAITQYDCYVDRTLAIFEKFRININKKYFAYQLEKKFAIEKESARGSTIKTITKEEFTEFTIPVPSLEEQNKVVTMLDKFNTLVNDISIGLPAELNARRQQYEYYRNKLLTFKEYVG